MGLTELATLDSPMSQWNPSLPTSRRLWLATSAAVFCALGFIQIGEAKGDVVCWWTIVASLRHGGLEAPIPIAVLAIPIATLSALAGWVLHVAILAFWKGTRRLWARAPATLS